MGLTNPVVLVTGGSGYIGGAITERLLGRAQLRSLTSHPERNRFDDRVRLFQYRFDRPREMADAFTGVDVFVNTYYVRFNRGTTNFERAVESSRALISLAQQARVGRIVHVSVSNASENSTLPYYRNKGRIERIVRESGLDYTILQPAVVAGSGDTLVNNIAYFLRRLPVFALFGSSDCRVQPMTLEAFVDVALEAIEGSHRAKVLPLAGPRDWTFAEMVRAIRSAIRSQARIVQAPSAVAFVGLKIAGLFLGDVVLTSDEIRGLNRECLYVARPLRRGEDFGMWLSRPGVASELGLRYQSELARHFKAGPKA
jgi:NADH dehydrogenase